MCMGEWEYMCEFCFVCFRSVHGWLGMHVWVNVFTMPLLCADSGPRRKMSRAWPPVSVKTTSSDSTCPSHQKSAWGAAEARQEKVIVEVVRKAISVAWRVFVEHTCKRFMSVLSAYRGAVLRSSANLPGRSPPPHWTGRGPVNESIMFGELPSILLFFFFFFFFLRSVHEFMGIDVWVNVFTMPFLCADSGPWRKMSRAWPPVSAIMT